MRLDHIVRILLLARPSDSHDEDDVEAFEKYVMSVVSMMFGSPDYL